MIKNTTLFYDKFLKETIYTRILYHSVGRDRTVEEDIVHGSH